jgi:P2 family phage contractile tail tube protein
MAADKVLKFLNLIVDGMGYAGALESYTSPDLTISTEEFRAGGMDAPIDLDMGMEKLTCSFKLKSYDTDLMALFGLRKGNGVQLTARGALEDRDGTVYGVVHAMRGKITQFQRGEWVGSTAPSLTLSLSLDYYREELDGRVLQELDVVNMIRVVDGVDQLSDHRAVLGL